MNRWFRSTVFSLAVVVLAIVAGFAVTGVLILKYSPALRDTTFVSRATSANRTPDEPATGSSTSTSQATEPATATTEVPDASPTETREPTATATSSPSATPTAASSMTTAIPETAATDTPIPVPTSTPAPSATPLPSWTPTRTLSPSATPTRTPLPRPPQPTKTPTPLPAPVLRYPREGMRFVAGEVVKVQWKPVGDLPEGVFYVPTVTYFHFGETWVDETPWLLDTSWTISEHDYLPFLSDNGVFRWSVQVMRQTGVDPVSGRPVGVPLTPKSEEWTFLWVRE